MSCRPVSALPYRYKFDEREIAAERPTAVSTCAVLFVLYAVFGSVMGLLNLFFDYPASLVFLKPLISVLLFSISVLAFLSLGGLLRGRELSRKLAVACCLVSYLMMGAFAFFLFFELATATAGDAVQASQGISIVQ